MDSTQFQPLPPEVERRIEALRGLTGAARTEALAALYRDFPEHAATLAARLAPDRSQVVTGGPALASVAERLRSLAERAAAARRYELHGEVARGGMGAILRAFDQDLGRTLAMKVILGHGDGDGSGGVVDPQVLDRFVEEAQITGQLDHPGVVPVHELGLDDKGRVYFTMRLVKGITAQEVFGLARDRAEGWTPTRALEVLLKVCDTLAYAHSKGVVHRDLKPSNVMVGKFGEVYVMDWGLAKVLGKADAHDLRIRPPESTLQSRVRTDRSKENESDPDTALRTMDGAIVGTPCYMPPEQAHGHVGDVGVRSDVYAAGAMLYTLLTGTQPYIRPGSKTSPYMILEWVREGPPAAVHKLEPKAPAELVAVCERAMARDMRARYAGMTELADDLRAYLEGRVVRAYRTGARAELVVWMRRNRGMAGGLLAAVVALVAGGAGAVVYAGRAEVANREAKEAQVVAVRERDVAKEERGKAEAARKDAEKALADLVEAEEQRRREKMKADRDRERSLSASRGLGWPMESCLRDCLTLESLRTLDIGFVKAGAAIAGVDDAGTRARIVEAELGPLRRLAEQWPGAHLWKEHIDQCGSMLLQLMPSNPSKPEVVVGGDGSVLRAAICRANASAHWQIGDLSRALAEQCRVVEEAREVRGRMAGVASDDWTRLVRGEMPWLTAAEQGLRRWESQIEAESFWGMLEVVAQAPTSEAARMLAVDAFHALGDAHQSKGSIRMSTADMQLALFGAFRAASRRGADGIPEIVASACRQLGLVGSSIALLNELQPESQSLQAIRTIELARALLAAHRPKQALAVLDKHLSQSPAAYFIMAQLRLVHELRALGFDMLQDRASVLLALEAAEQCTMAQDRVTRQRLAIMRGDVLRMQGAPELALAAYSRCDQRLVRAELERLPTDVCLRVAAAATQSGDLLLARGALQQARSRSQGGGDKIELLLQDARSELTSGNFAAAAKAGERLSGLLDGRTDPWLHARCRVHLAAALSAEQRGREAIVELDRGARLFAEWSIDYGRFHGSPVGPAQSMQLEEMGRSAMATLVDVAQQLKPEDMAMAWRVIETWREPLVVALGQRPATMRALGQVAKDYEEVRAEWLQRRIVTANGAIEADSRVRLAVGVRGRVEELESRERRLRSIRPDYMGAVLPRIPTLADARAALPEDSGLVVFGEAGGRAVAFVLTRLGASLVPLTFPAENVVGSAATLDAWGREVMAPILASAPLSDTSSWRRLLLAPTTSVASVPLHLCPVAVADGPGVVAAQPLLSKCDVAYAPSGVAALDRLAARRSVSRDGTDFGLVLTARGASSEEGGWMGGVLSAMLPADRAIWSMSGAESGASRFLNLADRATAIGICLPLDIPIGAPHMAALRAVGSSDVSPAVSVGYEALLGQDLRDLSTKAELVVVRVTGQSPSAGDLEAAALASFVRGLWSGGAASVVTVAAGSPLDAATDLLRAVAVGLRRGEGPVAAWCAASRGALRRGVAPSDLWGIRLWSTNR